MIAVSIVHSKYWKKSGIFAIPFALIPSQSISSARINHLSLKVDINATHPVYVVGRRRGLNQCHIQIIHVCTMQEIRYTFSLTLYYITNDNITISWVFFWLTAPRCPGMAAGAVSLRKSHDIIILSFWNIVKGQANLQLLKFYKCVDIFLRSFFVTFYQKFCKTHLLHYNTIGLIFTKKYWSGI